MLPRNQIVRESPDRDDWQRGDESLERGAFRQVALPAPLPRPEVGPLDSVLPEGTIIKTPTPAGSYVVEIDIS